MTATEEAICLASRELFGTPEEQTASALAGEGGGPPADLLVSAGLLTADQANQVLDAAYERVRSRGGAQARPATPPPRRSAGRRASRGSSAAGSPSLASLLQRLRDINEGRQPIARPVLRAPAAAAPARPDATIVPEPSQAERKPAPAPAPRKAPRKAPPKPAKPKRAPKFPEGTIDLLMIADDPTPTPRPTPPLAPGGGTVITAGEGDDPQQILLNAAIGLWASRKHGLGAAELEGAREHGGNLGEGLVLEGHLDLSDIMLAMEDPQDLQCPACESRYEIGRGLESHALEVQCPVCGNALGKRGGDARTVNFTAGGSPIAGTEAPLYAAGTDAPDYLGPDSSTGITAAGYESPTRANPTAQSIPSGGLANYELLGELARGGMGIVYKARQKGLGRIVCLKVMRSAELANENDRRRFMREAEASARLNHPGIVPIHEVGEHHGQCFFSMDFIEGKELGHYVRDETPPMRAIVEVLVDVCDAIHYAHMRGIIHRDLKPANVMVDLDKKPHVMDFGIAKRLDASEDTKHGPMTQEGEIMGTPHYMSPEQAEGRISEIDVRSDVFSLGVICYELFTGKRPFQDDNILRLIKMVVHVDPTSLRVVRPDLDMDLETIVLKAMEKEKARRYQSALELKAELQRWLDGEPILARRATIAYKLKKWSNRNKTQAATYAVSGVGFLLMIFLYAAAQIGEYYQRRGEIEDHVREGQTELQGGKPDEAFNRFGQALILEPREEPALRGRVDAALALAERAMAENNPGAAESVLRQVEYLGPRPDEIQAALQSAGRERRRLVEVGVERQKAFVEATQATLAELAALPVDRGLTYEQEQGYVFDLVGQKDPATMALLRAAIADAQGHPLVRLIGTKALGWMRDTEAVPVIGRLVSAEQPSLPLAYAAADALGWIGGEQAWEALLEAREGRDAVFRSRTQPAMQRIAQGLSGGGSASFDLEAEFLRADRFRQAGDHQSAVRSYDRALSREPGAVEGYLGRALALLALNQLERAEEDLDVVVPAGGPSLAPALINRAEVRRRRGNLQGAMSDLDTLLRINDKRADGYLARGRLWLEQGDPERAIPDLKQAISLQPDYAQAFASRAEAELARKNLDDALADANTALRVAPKEPAFFLVRCRVHMAQGDHGAAARDAALAATLQPNLVRAYTLQALALRREGKPDRALQVLRAGHQRTKAVELIVEQARVHHVEGRHAEARRVAEQALAAKPSAALGLTAQEVRGVSALAEGDLEAALTDLRAVAKARPERASAHYNLACALARSQDVDGALQALQQAVKRGLSRETLQSDPDLATLRGRPEFVSLVEGEDQ